MPKPQQHLDHLLRRIRWDELDAGWLRRLIEMAREEDLAGGGLSEKPNQPSDATTALLPEGAQGSALLIAREPMTLCGLGLIPMILEVYGKGVDCAISSPYGDKMAIGGVIGELSGSVSTLLQAERVILNFIQRLSGIATATANMVELLGPDGPRLLDTRKTTPGYRMLEKYAVACGGGWNHRLGLFDRIMLKDNHLAAGDAAGGKLLAEAVRRAKAARPDLAIEVEVDRMEQIGPIIEAGADVILLDNFTFNETRDAISLIGDKCWTEASGGITEESVKELAGLGLDFISTGAVVHRSRWVDIGLDWKDHG